MIGGLDATLVCVEQADYTRYEGMHLWQTMTGAARRPGQLLRRRLAGFLRPKCHPILLDTAINSRTTVRLNIYQVPRGTRLSLRTDTVLYRPIREFGIRSTTSAVADSLARQPMAKVPD